MSRESRAKPNLTAERGDAEKHLLSRATCWWRASSNRLGGWQIRFGNRRAPQLKKPPPQVHQVHSLSGFISLEYELVDFASSSKFIKFIPIPKAEIPRLRSGFRQQGSHPSNRNTGVCWGPRLRASLRQSGKCLFCLALMRS